MGFILEKMWEETRQVCRGLEMSSTGGDLGETQRLKNITQQQNGYQEKRSCGRPKTCVEETKTINPNSKKHIFWRTEAQGATLMREGERIPTFVDLTLLFLDFGNSYQKQYRRWRIKTGKLIARRPNWGEEQSPFGSG